MFSEKYKLGIEDFAKGAIVAVLAVVLGALQQAVTAHGFDFAAYDWGSIGNVAGTAFIAYLSKNFFTDRTGIPFGGN